MRRSFAWLSAGFVAGYVGVRAAEALADLRRPSAALPKDPSRYGSIRRKLMLAAIARNLTGSAAVAFELADRMAPPIEKRFGRLAPAVYFSAMLACETFIETPVDYVEHFVLERRFGMSDQRVGAWLGDRLKGLAVAVAFGAPLSSGLVALSRRFPRAWPFGAALAVPPLLVLANIVVPLYVAPLFNRFEALATPLEKRLRHLADRYGAGDAQIFRADFSRRTKKVNAYVTGLFGTHRIVVGDTLLDGFGENEIEFIVAHELGHYVGRDTWIGVGLGSLFSTAVIFGGHALARRDDDPVTTLPALQRFSFYATVLSMVLGPLVAACSRAIERRADRFAVTATNDPRSGVTAFEKLRERNLAEDEQPRWAELLVSTHPSLRSRISTLRQAATN